MWIFKVYVYFKKFINGEVFPKELQLTSKLVSVASNKPVAIGKNLHVKSMSVWKKSKYILRADWFKNMKSEFLKSKPKENQIKKQNTANICKETNLFPIADTSWIHGEWMIIWCTFIYCKSVHWEDKYSIQFFFQIHFNQLT